MQYFIWCKKMFLKFFPAFFLFYHATATVRSWFWWKFTKFSRSLKHFHQFNISVVLGFLVLCQTNYSGCVFFPSKNDYFTRSILKLPSFFACSLFPLLFVRMCEFAFYYDLWNGNLINKWNELQLKYIEHDKSPCV